MKLKAINTTRWLLTTNGLKDKRGEGLILVDLASGNTIKLSGKRDLDSLCNFLDVVKDEYETD